MCLTPKPLCLFGCLPWHVIRGNDYTALFYIMQTDFVQELCFGLVSFALFEVLLIYLKDNLTQREGETARPHASSAYFANDFNNW